MTLRLSRRRALQVSAGLLVYRPAPVFAATEPVAVAQSGEPPGAFAVGALIAADAGALRAAIAALRDQTKYRRVFRARSTDKIKETYGRGLIKLLFADGGASFRAVYAAAQSGLSMAEARKRLLRDVVGPAPVMLAAATPRAKSKRSFALAKALTSDIGISGGIEFRHPKDDDLLQAAGFFTALVRMDNENSAKGVNATLLADLKATLKVTRLGDAPAAPAAFAVTPLGP